MQDQEFKLKVSVIYCAFLDAMLLGCFLIILLLPFAVWIRALLLALLVVYGGMILWRYALLRASASVTALQRVEGRRWRITTRGGVIEGVLRGDSTVTSFVSILRFAINSEKRPFSCIVLLDSMPSDDYRRLVSLIRMG